jgi:peptidoglycan/xylan/chitin deacetylase (PgdA/CDA1 family)
MSTPTAFNLSVDFEQAWGDLDRATRDDAFHQQVLAGLDHTPEVLDVLSRTRLPSLWGVVGACCHSSLEELAAVAPRAYAKVEPSLRAMAAHRPQYARALFCPDTVERIARHEFIELASHGFLHLTPRSADADVLREDVAASTAKLGAISGRHIESFIPPENYDWPDAAFSGSGIRFVRHTPSVFAYSYSDPRVPAKFARLWNDFVAPVAHRDEQGRPARLLFLRLDRGARLWDAQLRLFERLLRKRGASLFCFTHPHNLDSPVAVRRFAQFCELVATARDRGDVTFRGFAREIPVAASRPA